MIKIDFLKLTQNFNSDLNNKLRGERGEGYLEFWVPDTIKVKSIYNLVDAIFESDNKEAEVINLKLTIDELDDLKSLKDIAFKSIDEDKIIVKIDIEKYTNYKEQNNKPQKINLQERVFEDVKDLKIFDANEDIDDYYYQAINDSNYKIKNKKNLDLKSQQIVKLNFLENQNIKLSLSSSDFIISDAIIDYQSVNKITKLLDIFCEIVKNKRLQEVAEHGVIYLEHEIQKMSKKKRDEVQGVYLPSNSGGIFNLLNLKLRETYIQLLKDKKIKEEINKDYYETNKEWLALSFEKQKKRIEEILETHVYRQYNINKDDISLLRVVLGNRLEFELSKNLTGDFEDFKLFRIEEIFKNSIDKSIELVTVEVKDSNKLRLTNAPKSI